MTTTPTAALPAPSPSATDAADSLLSHLAPLFPAVAAAAKTESGAQAWVQAWARNIHLAALTHNQIARGLTRLARGEHDPDIPLSWSVFYRLCIDPWRDCNDPVDPAERERKLREFRAKHPGVRFAEDMVKPRG